MRQLVVGAPAPKGFLLGVVLASLLVMSGCSAGQITQTSAQVSGVSGASGQVGDIVVRDAVIAFPPEPRGEAAYRPGDSAPLKMTIVNVGSQLDRLIAVTSPVASTVTTIGDPTVPGQEMLVVGQPADVTVPGTKRIDVILDGVLVPLKPGGIGYEVVLNFERAGALRLAVPVGNPAETLEP